MVAVTVKKISRVATKRLHAVYIMRRLRVEDEAGSKKTIYASGDSLTHWVRSGTYDRPVQNCIILVVLASFHVRGIFFFLKFACSHDRDALQGCLR